MKAKLKLPLRLVAISGGLQSPSKTAALAEHLMNLIANEIPCEQRLVKLGQLAPQLGSLVWRSNLPDLLEQELAAVEQADVTGRHLQHGESGKIGQATAPRDELEHTRHERRVN